MSYFKILDSRKILKFQISSFNKFRNKKFTYFKKIIVDIGKCFNSGIWNAYMFVSRIRRGCYEEFIEGDMRNS